MPNYLAPGVYIEEVPSGARPIEAVGTSTAAFVGIAPNAAANIDDDGGHKAVRINNWTKFVKEFGTLLDKDGKVIADINNWTKFVKEYGTPDDQSVHLAQAVYGFFLNGGTVCYIVNIGKDKVLVGKRRGLHVLETVDDVAIVAAPGFTEPQDQDAVLTHCELMKDRVAILDAPEEVLDIDDLTKVATAKVLKKSRPAEGGDSASAPESSGLRPRQSDGGYGAVYYPWITVPSVFNPKELINVPPSGYLAGIYARTDGTRGVHKAPANEAIRGAVNIAYPVAQQDQERLNPNGVNCIRFFPNEGIRVWGARTLAASASEWRYINVRRLFNMIEKSIIRSTRWVVFEPNDVSLWKSIKRDVSAFLMLVWRQGALMGRTPEEAFFVKCDEETNPVEEIDAGRVNILIGIAPVKPAEFVIFRIGQGLGGAEVTAEGGGNA